MVRAYPSKACLAMSVSAALARAVVIVFVVGPRQYVVDPTDAGSCAPLIAVDAGFIVFLREVLRRKKSEGEIALLDEERVRDTQAMLAARVVGDGPLCCTGPVSFLVSTDPYHASVRSAHGTRLEVSFVVRDAACSAAVDADRE